MIEEKKPSGFAPGGYIINRRETIKLAYPEYPTNSYKVSRIRRIQEITIINSEKSVCLVKI